VIFIVTTGFFSAEHQERGTPLLCYPCNHLRTAERSPGTSLSVLAYWTLVPDHSNGDRMQQEREYVAAKVDILCVCDDENILLIHSFMPLLYWRL